jgi:hypothetical protein
VTTQNAARTVIQIVVQTIAEIGFKTAVEIAVEIVVIAPTVGSGMTVPDRTAPSVTVVEPKNGAGMTAEEAHVVEIVGADRAWIGTVVTLAAE